MIASITGIVQAVTDKHVIIDVRGVGYRVAMPAKMKIILPGIGSTVKLYTHFVMSPRDGSVELYGFENADELAFFEMLTSVSGIGPKSAQGILAATDLATLQAAIMNGDSASLSKMSGIGTKTAQRLILELKTKIAALPLGGLIGEDFRQESEAIDALMSLGYSQFQARDAVRAVAETAKTTEAKITEALKIIGKK